MDASFDSWKHWRHQPRLLRMVAYMFICVLCSVVYYLAIYVYVCTPPSFSPAGAHDTTHGGGAECYGWLLLGSRITSQLLPHHMVVAYRARFYSNQACEVGQHVLNLITVCVFMLV
jgi:hypothetical protein